VLCEIPVLSVLPYLENEPLFYLNQQKLLVNQNETDNKDKYPSIKTVIKMEIP
jgi:hypothetical protein